MARAGHAKRFKDKLAGSHLAFRKRNYLRAFDSFGTHRRRLIWKRHDIKKRFAQIESDMDIFVELTRKQNIHRGIKHRSPILVSADLMRFKMWVNSAN